MIALIRKNVMESIEKCLPKLYQSLREEFTFRLLWGIEGVTRYLRSVMMMLRVHHMRVIHVHVCACVCVHHSLERRVS